MLHIGPRERTDFFADMFSSNGYNVKNIKSTENEAVEHQRILKPRNNQFSAIVNQTKAYRIIYKSLSQHGIKSWIL